MILTTSAELPNEASADVFDYLTKGAPVAADSINLNVQGVSDLDAQQLSDEHLASTDRKIFWRSLSSVVRGSLAEIYSTNTSLSSGSKDLDHRCSEDPHQWTSANSAIRAGVEDLLGELRTEIKNLPLDDHWKISKRIYSDIVKKLTLLLYKN